MKNLIFLTLCLGITAFIFQPTNAVAGRYDGLVEVFNKAARGMDDVPLNKLEPVYKPKGFDPPGMNGPSTQVPPIPRTPPPSSPPSLTNTFNGVAK